MSSSSSKSPAFQFYPHDFLAGRVATYPMEARGVYITLLSFDWTLNGLPTDEFSLARLCGISSRKFASVWPIIADQFPVVQGEGAPRRFNPRLQLEREKQAAWREKSAKGGRAKAAKGGTTVVAPPLVPNGCTPSPSPTPVTTNCATTTPRAREVLDRFAESDRDAVATFLAGLPSSQSADVWAAAVGGWLDGLGMPRNRPAPPGIIAVALRDWVTRGEQDYSPAYVRAFVLRVAREWKQEQDRERDGARAVGNDPARQWLALAKRHDLLSFSGNRAEYAERRARAKADPEAPARFDAEFDVVRLWDGLGGMEERFVLKAIQERLAGSERRAAA